MEHKSRSRLLTELQVKCLHICLYLLLIRNTDFKGGSANSVVKESPAFTLDTREIEDFYVRLKRQVVPGWIKMPWSKVLTRDSQSGFRTGWDSGPQESTYFYIKFKEQTLSQGRMQTICFMQRTGTDCYVMTLAFITFTFTLDRHC